MQKNKGKKTRKIFFPHRDGGRNGAHTVLLYNRACPVLDCEARPVHLTTNLHTWHKVKQNTPLQKIMLSKWTACLLNRYKEWNRHLQISSALYQAISVCRSQSLNLSASQFEQRDVASTMKQREPHSNNNRAECVGAQNSDCCGTADVWSVKGSAGKRGFVRLGFCEAFWEMERRSWKKIQKVERKSGIPMWFVRSPHLRWLIETFLLAFLFQVPLILFVFLCAWSRGVGWLSDCGRCVQHQPLGQLWDGAWSSLDVPRFF